MSMIDDIKRDAETGTPGPWQSDDAFMHHGHPTRVATPDICGVPAATLAECLQNWDDFRVSWKNAEANARRCARVPEMEAALIAADELAAAARHYRDFVMDHGASGEVVPLTTEPAHRLMVALRNYTKEIGGDA